MGLYVHIHDARTPRGVHTVLRTVVERLVGTGDAAKHYIYTHSDVDYS